MNDTAVITNDLDRLAERVERAATLVTSLRNRCSDLEKLGAATQQQLDDLNAKLQGQDAKARVGNESSKFFSKGWVIGSELAKISPDGLSITFYPQEVASLVQELIGYPSADENQ